MPIRSLLDEGSGSFSPEDIASIVKAFEAALGSLGLSDRRNDPALLLVAKTTLEIAKQGELDPTQLSIAVVRRMTT